MTNLKASGFAVLLVTLGVLTRLFPHPVNFTALGAIALWSMTLFPSKAWAVLIPVIALLISDALIGFHSTMVWVYGSILFIATLSLVIQPKQSWGRTLLGSLSASLIFFVLTNLGVWLGGELYPMTTEGFFDCYAMAIPFLKNQIAGDLIFSFGFGLVAKYLLVQRRVQNSVF